MKHKGRDFVFFGAHPLSGAYVSGEFCDDFGRHVSDLPQISDSYEGVRCVIDMVLRPS